ncbi:MAG: hypothetical protein O2860_09100 [Chloroflexi bacterium]|nr:hypothetical protein [Chloroflexota bacterium]
MTFQAEGPVPEPTHTPVPGNNQIVLVTRNEPTALGAFATGCGGDGNISGLVCEDLASDPLTYIDSSTFEAVPLSGIEGWEQIAPGRWRFHLRPGVTFHNGEPWDAAAAKLGVDFLGDKATAGHGTLSYLFHGALTGEIVDGLTLDIVCDVTCPI